MYQFLKTNQSIYVNICTVCRHLASFWHFPTKRKRKEKAMPTWRTVKPWICSPTLYCSALSLAETLFHLHDFWFRDLKQHFSLKQTRSDGSAAPGSEAFSRAGWGQRRASRWKRDRSRSLPASLPLPPAPSPPSPAAAQQPPGRPVAAPHGSAGRDPRGERRTGRGRGSQPEQRRRRGPAACIGGGRLRPQPRPAPGEPREATRGGPWRRWDRGWKVLDCGGGGGTRPENVWLWGEAGETLGVGDKGGGYDKK